MNPTESAAAEALLQEHVDLFVTGCLRRLPAVQAIILYGSYGRGEGAWYRDEQGALRPYNDFDFCIVAAAEMPVADLMALKDEVREAAGIRWVDAFQCSTADLARLPPTIRNYDLKYASRVVHGDVRVLDRIPSIDAEALTAQDAETLYFTRLYTFLGSLDERGMDGELGGEASRFFRNQMAKGVLAVVDVLLLQKGAYDASYAKRVNRVRELFPDKAEVIELAGWALQEKLQPRAPRMDAAATCELYEKVRRIYLDEMYEALTRRFGRRVTGPDMIERHLRWSPARLARRLFWLARFRDRRAHRTVDLGLAQSYLLAAWKPDGVDERWLARAQALLRRGGVEVHAGLNWHALRIASVRVRQ